MTATVSVECGSESPVIRCTRGWTYAVELWAATITQVGTAFNVGAGTSVTITELAETIVEMTKSASEITHTDGRDGDIRHSEADIAAIQTDLDSEPTVSLHDGLAQTVAWLREQ